MAGGNVSLIGGSITGNTAGKEGGGVYMTRGQLIFSGGSITGNSARAGGGVAVSGGKLTMLGSEGSPTITKNTASVSGGGVYLYSGTVDMSAGEITDNKASGVGGGGVYVRDGTFDFYAGYIGKTGSGNTGSMGGGVALYGGTFNMRGYSSFIQGNNAGSGGGVAVMGASASFNLITYGWIKSNTASSHGGGVYLFDGSFTLNHDNSVFEAEISDNKAADKDDNVYLCEGRKITVAEELQNATPIGVSMEKPGTFTDGYKAKMDGKDPADYFTGDDKTYSIGLDKNGEALLGVAYSVTVNESLLFKVTAEKAKAFAGETVTLTVEEPPEELPFVLKALTVTYTEDGKTKTLTPTKGSDGKYTFTMPAADVTVKSESARLHLLVVKESDGGKVATDQDNDMAIAGETVTLTLSVNAGYRLEALNVTYVDVETKTVATTKVDDTHYTFVMPDASVYVTAELLTPWMKLQKQINEASDGVATTITLANDVAFLEDADDGPIIVPAGKKIALDLGSYAIDRGLPQDERERVEDGNVITVNGSLTVTGSGTIKGGNNEEHGGGVIVGENGSFTLSGGTISGNMASIGGGVYVNEGGAITLTGGSITNNKANNAIGGVRFESGTFNISGNPSVQGNHGFVSEYNVYLGSDARINVIGPLDAAARIGVYDMPIKVITRGLEGNGTAENFTSDLSTDDNGREYAVAIDDDGEAYIGTQQTVIIDPDNGSEKRTLTVVSGGKVPQSADPEKDGYVFSEWQWAVGEGYDLNGHFDFDNTTVSHDLYLKAVYITYWQDLQNRINAAEDGQTITLTRDVTAAADEAALNVPEGKNVTLNLNGHTIDRALTEAKENGNVITVNGSLTVTDSGNGGTIKGGNNTGKGGGVLVDSGSFTLNGGAITGNKATYGGGVFVDGGSFTLSGGTVSGNEATYTGGVLIDSGAFNLSGDAVIQDNTAQSNGANVYLPTDATIAITGALGDTARVGVTMAQPNVFTSGLSGKGAAENFISDDEGYMVGIKPNGEAYLETAITVTFNTDGGSKVESQKIIKGAIPDRPEDPTKDGYVFKGWLFNDNPYSFGILTTNTTLTAKWITVWQDLQEQTNNAANGATITLSGDVTAVKDVDTQPITVPEGKKITLDLGSYTLDRGLPQDINNAKPDGSVITVRGELTVTGKGIIRGGNASRGGGVYVDTGAKFTLASGLITDNTAGVYGGGVYVHPNATFTLTGGSITRNTAYQYGGVYCASSGAFELSGDPVVRNNIPTGVSDVKVSNVGFTDVENGRITVTGKLGEKASIGVDKIPGVFTTGLKGNGTEKNFTSDYAGFKVYLTADGEAELNTPWGWLQNRINNARDGEIIQLNGDVNAQPYEKALVVPEGKNVTIDLNRFRINRRLENLTEDGNVITVNGSLTVVDTSTTQAGLITGGNNQGNGGGVIVGKTGSFTLAGGLIQNNTAAANAGGVLNNGTFKMTGGAVSDNNATGNGGGVSNNGTFSLSGGKVGGNGSTVYGGGVFNGGTFKMTGGEVSGNTVTGNNALGGGVYNVSTFEMTGGEISGNVASNHGGGVLNNGTFNMSGGTIRKNEADLRGGGAYNLGTFNMSGSAAIEGNTSGYEGGGVALSSTEAVFNMTGSAAIKDNTSNEQGGGVHVELHNALGLSGGVEISGNKGKGNVDDNVCLRYDSPTSKAIIKVEGKLTNARPIGVGVQKASENTPDSIAVTVGLKGKGTDANFVSELEGYEVFLNADGEAILSTPWTWLQGRINDAKNGETIRLPMNADAQPYEKALVVPEGKNVTIDLNGFRINRQLKEAAEDGNVFTVNGSLTVKDSGKGGVITGGNNRGNGGGVVVGKTGSFTLEGGLIQGNATSGQGGGVINNGTFNMSGGTISKNKADLRGGGVYNQSTFNMSGSAAINGNTSGYEGGGVALSSTAAVFSLSGSAAILNNTSTNAQGGGVHVELGGTFKLSGGVEISGNKGKDGVDDNVCLKYDSPTLKTIITVEGKLTNAKPIGVGVQKASQTTPDYIDVTAGLNGDSTDSVKGFTSELEGYQVFLNADSGEAILAVPVDIVLDKNGASATGSMEGLTMPKGIASKLYANQYTWRGHSFAGWNTAANGSGTRYEDEGVVTVSAKTTFYAQWTAHDFTVAAIPAQTYAGKALTPAPVVKDKTTGKMLKAGADYTVAYKNNVNAGTATATVTGKGDYAEAKAVSVTFAINKAAPTVTAPTAKTLTANGSAQALVNAGKATGGTMQYSTDNKTWSTTVPTGTDAKDYTVYYRVQGDANHTDVAAKSVKVTIAPKPTATPAPTKRPAAPDYTILASMKASGNKALKLSWTKVKGAEGYDIFFKTCDGKGNYPLRQTVGGTVTSYTIEGLKKGKCYKGYIKAWKTVNGAKTYIGKASPKVHAIAGGYNSANTNAKSVTVKAAKVTLLPGKSSTIKVSVKGVKSGRKLLNHTNKLRYYSSDRNVATISSAGKIKAKGTGSCTIYVVANNGVRASVKVTVTSKPTKVSFKKSSYSVKKGKTLKLADQVKLTPAKAITSLSWKSSNPAVATVDSNGVVSAIKKGKTVITVTTANGKKAKVTIKVK